jgi:hypothetical protein
LAARKQNRGKNEDLKMQLHNVQQWMQQTKHDATLKKNYYENTKKNRITDFPEQLFFLTPSKSLW